MRKFVFLLILIFFCFCSLQGANQINIAFVSKNADFGFTKEVYQGALEGAKERSYKESKNINLKRYFYGENFSSLSKNLLLNNFDLAIIDTPSIEVKEAVKDYIASGGKVIFTQNDLENLDVNAYQSNWLKDAEILSKELVNEIKKTWRRSKSIAIFQPKNQSLYLSNLINNCVATIENQSVKVLKFDYDYNFLSCSKALDEANELLNSDCIGVVIIGDYITNFPIKMKQEDMFIYALNASAINKVKLEKGQINAILNTDLYFMGYLAVNYIIDEKINSLKDKDKDKDKKPFDKINFETKIIKKAD